MTPEEFPEYTRERLEGGAKRIPHPYQPNRLQVMEAMRLMEEDRELCRVGLGDVIGIQR